MINILLIVLVLVVVFILADPYFSWSLFTPPYKTVQTRGKIDYIEVYRPIFLSAKLFNWLGYIKSGVLILKFRFFPAKIIYSRDYTEVLERIHTLRFDPDRPYLISGDQFSVLYPRNMGVFYNRVLERSIAPSEEEWVRRQRICLQSVLFAVNGLSKAKVPPTTLVPLAPRIVSLTNVHPGSIASDTVYGILYMLDKLSQSDTYTHEAATRLLRENHATLTALVASYIDVVQDSKTLLVHDSVHLASARDGAIRSSSLYDNIVLWKTLQLADVYEIVPTPRKTLENIRQAIHKRYWSDERGYYRNDASDDSFSSDWLIGYVCGFFDIKNNPIDLQRAQKCISYAESNNLCDPLPIRYQVDARPKSAPWFVKYFVSSYGGSAIWSYWGCEYITLLLAVYEQTNDLYYLKLAKKYIDIYEAKILEFGCFPETFDENGSPLRTMVYRSILNTGWAVQYEYARARYDELNTKT